MAEIYDSIRKSMFAYFCKHHSQLIEENFAVPRRVKIGKKPQRQQTRRYFPSGKLAVPSASVQISHTDVELAGKGNSLLIDRELVNQGSY